jgi:hypothetical protein
MKRKTTVILIFIVVIVVPAITAEAEERHNLEDNVQRAEEEPKLISPSPFSEEIKSETPLVIAPANTDKKIDVPNSSIDKSDLLLSVGLPIFVMICAAASTSLALFVLYKKK